MELTQLRRHNGMSIPRVDEHAVALRRLPAVIDEARRRKLPDSQLATAVYHVIICFLRTGLTRRDYATVLAMSLNISGDLDGLEGRRRSFAEAGGFSERALYRLEQDAYSHLAAELLALRRSPCRDPSPLSSTPQRHELTVTVAGSSELLALLRLFGDPQHDFFRLSIAKHIVGLLPKIAVDRGQKGKEMLHRMWYPKDPLRNIEAIDEFLTHIVEPRYEHRYDLDIAPLPFVDVREILIGDDPGRLLSIAQARGQVVRISASLVVETVEFKKDLRVSLESVAQIMESSRPKADETIEFTAVHFDPLLFKRSRDRT